MMGAGVDGGGAGSARRLRKRRLRSLPRHWTQSVAASLAEALHHSADRSSTLPYEDRRKPEPRRRQYARCTQQKALLPGVLPGALFEHGMQRDVSRVASPVGVGPSLVALELDAGRTSGGDVEFLSLLLLCSGATVLLDPCYDAPEVRLGHAASIPRGLQSGLPALGLRSWTRWGFRRW